MSLLLALALCLSLLPTAALAEDTQAAAQPVLAEQESPAEEQEVLPVPEKTPAEEQPETPETPVTASEPDEAVRSVQAQIDALPGVDELEVAYMSVQAAYDAYEALTEAQQAELTGAECFKALFGWFNEQVTPLDETIYLDDVDANAAGSVEVMNNRAYSYEFDLAALLPELESPMEYGDVTYTLGTVSINGGYYDAEQGKAVIKDGKLLLPIKAVPSETEQNIGTVTVTVSSENIENFDLTITAKAVNKIVPTGVPKLSKDTLAWGEPLDTIPSPARWPTPQTAQRRSRASLSGLRLMQRWRR